MSSFNLSVKSSTEATLIRKALIELSKDYRADLEDRGANVSTKKRCRWRRNVRKCGEIVERLDAGWKLSRDEDGS